MNISLSKVASWLLQLRSQDYQKGIRYSFRTSSLSSLWREDGRLPLTKIKVMIMLRNTLSSVSMRAVAVSRQLAPAVARRTTLSFPGPSCRAAHAVTADPVRVAAACTRRLPQQNILYKNMCSASNRQKPTDDEPHGEDGTESGDDMGSTSGGHSRDPNTGEGMWIDDEDEVRWLFQRSLTVDFLLEDYRAVEV